MGPLLIQLFTVSVLTIWLLESPDFRQFYPVAYVDLFFFLFQVMLYATNGLRTGSSLQDLGFRGYLQYFSLLCNPALE